jgi:CubicO group peptidase (beta-lactamase class C family)
VDRPNYVSLAAAVHGEAARHNVPGIAIGVLSGGQVTTAVAGFANLQAKRAVTPNTLFQMGSISKVFTATLVQILVQEGTLDLDVPVRTYLPDFRLSDEDAAATITLRHLLSHTSGIEGDFFEDFGLGDDAAARAIARFPELKQWNAPGELFAYCNSGFYLTGEIIRQVTGSSFEAALREKLLGPLGTPDITAFTDDAIVRDHAVGYNLTDRTTGHQVADPFAFSRNVTAAGNLMTPVDQLLRFAHLHLNDGEIDGTRLLDPALARAMRTPSPAAAEGQQVFGIGWALRPVNGVPAVMHNGGTNGFRALLILLPDRDFAVAVLTNGSRGDAAHGALADWAIEHYRGIAPAPKPETVSLKPKQIARWAGIWERHDRRFTLGVTDGALTGTVESLEPRVATFTGDKTAIALDPLSETHFRVRDGEYEGLVLEFIELDPDRKGNYRALMRAGSRLAERAAS